MPKDYDIRKMIHEIREINNMETADVYPGDLVKVPINIKNKNRSRNSPIFLYLYWLKDYF